MPSSGPTSCRSDTTGAGAIAIRSEAPRGAPFVVRLKTPLEGETVIADAPVVDVQNPRQAVTFDGTELRDLPTTRNINSLLALTPGPQTPRVKKTDRRVQPRVQ